MSLYKEACEKLEREAKAGNFERKEAAMKSAVLKALKEFCRQSEELCRMVMEGRSFEECMKAVAKDVGNSISDLEAYRRAVAYYWAKAKISFVMKIEGEGQITTAPAASAPFTQGSQEPVELIDLSEFL